MFQKVVEFSFQKHRHLKDINESLNNKKYESPEKKNHGYLLYLFNNIYFLKKCFYLGMYFQARRKMAKTCIKKISGAGTGGATGPPNIWQIS